MPKNTTKEIKSNNDLKKSQCCNALSILDGFRFGFGIFVAFLTGTLIIIAIAYAFWKMAEIF